MNGGSGGQNIEKLNKGVVLKKILLNKKGVLLEKMTEVEILTVLSTICEN